MVSNKDQFGDNSQIGAGYQGVISDFYSWIQGLRSYHYQYIVCTTRRASNLLEIIRTEYPDTLPDYITENALLLQAESNAKFYARTRLFHKIAILDDILVYGRNMNLLLSQYWSTIRQCLNQMEADLEEAEAAFNQSVNLWIYAVNEPPFLLRHEFQWTLHGQRMLAENEWRPLSDAIAKLIAREDVANTSYVISAKLPDGSDRYRPDFLSWISEKKLRYRKNRQEYEFYLFSQAAGSGVYPSVRSYRTAGGIYYTPYFFMPELTWAQVVRTLKTLFDFSAKEDLETTNKCIHLLNRIKTCSSRMMVYAQFTTLLLSQVTLSVFFGDLAPQLAESIEYDTEKISRNFGFAQKMGPILRGFCAIKWDEIQLLALLQCLDLSNEAGDPWTLPAVGNQGDLINTMERLVYKQSVDHERDAEGRRQNDPDDVPVNLHVNQTGEQEFGQFLSRVKEKTGAGSDAESMLPVLSCLTQMMDLGDISLKARSKRREGGPVFYSSVRTTEMSLAIMPRKLGGYFRQFYLLAQLYWRDQDFPDRVERYFLDTIFSGDPGGKNAVMIDNARYFAQLISENRMIVNSMLNWQIAPD